MKNYIFLVTIILICSCNSQKNITFIYKDGNLAVKKVYNNKDDTSIYSFYQYYENGALKYKAHVINNKLEGGYCMYSPKGFIIEKGTYLDDYWDGLLQVHDTAGNLSSERYFVDKQRVLYSEFYEGKNGSFVKQVFYKLKNDTNAFYIGKITKERGVLRPDMSFYAFISADDTISCSSYCFKLTLLIEKEKYPIRKITFGMPDRNLDFFKVDTTFTTSDSIVKFCYKKLKPGINHIFCEVRAYSEKDTAIFYPYRDIYVQTSK